MNLQEQFDNAKEKAPKLVEKLSGPQKLEIYQYFKQATLGDVTGSRPGIFDQAGRYKFDAWSSVKGLSKEEAMRKYIDTITTFENM